MITIRTEVPRRVPMRDRVLIGLAWFLILLAVFSTPVTVFAPGVKCHEAMKGEK